MRRLVLMLGMVALISVMATGVAFAVTKTCNGIPCTGTDNEDVLHEREGTKSDRILAMDDHDVLDANNFFSDKDVLKGGGGPDKLLANDIDNRDVLRGGAGRDRCHGDENDRFVNCEVVRRHDASAAAQDF
jgi:hypothetical protein